MNLMIIVNLFPNKSTKKVSGVFFGLEKVRRNL